MKKILLIILAIISLNLFAQNNFTAKWDNGFKVQSEDKNFVLKFGGRIYYDVAFFFQDSMRIVNFGEIKNGHEFRSARLYHSGVIYENLKYKFNIDFAGGKVAFKDVYIEYTKIPYIGNLRVGHFYTPVGLEANTSSKYISFMESASLSTYTPSRNTGFMIYNSFLKNKINVQAGVFRFADKFGNNKIADEGVRVQAKVSSDIINNKETKTIFHIGASYEYSYIKDGRFTIKTSPEAHLGRIVYKKEIEDNEHIDLGNFETVLVKGSFSFQAEVSLFNAHQKNSLNYFSYGYYVYASYFITGETRNYKGINGFSRIKPKKNVGKNGFGALEILFRYSRLDARKRFQAGLMDNYTVGLNWYLNPSSRIMVNYIFSSFVEEYDPTPMNAQIVQTRFQIDF